MDAPAWEFSATGTRWRLYHSGELDDDAARTIAAAIERDEARWSRFRADSEISHLNRSAGEWVEVSAETCELLEACAAWTALTAGVFQPLVGAALRAWGYRRSISEQPPFAAAAPRSEPVAGAVRLDAARRRASVPAGGAVDVGGIGKSWIAARAGRLLQRLSDDPRLLIDAGGDIVAITGSHVIAVGEEIEGWVRLAPGEAIATSGVSQRTWVNGDGSASHHLIDPRTGAPGPLAHATVLAADPVTADVRAKVLALCPDAVADCEHPALVRYGGHTRTNPAWEAVTVAQP